MIRLRGLRDRPLPWSRRIRRPRRPPSWPARCPRRHPWAYAHGSPRSIFHDGTEGGQFSSNRCPPPRSPGSLLGQCHSPQRLGLMPGASVCIPDGLCSCSHAAPVVLRLCKKRLAMAGAESTSRGRRRRCLSAFLRQPQSAQRRPGVQPQRQQSHQHARTRQPDTAGPGRGERWRARLDDEADRTSRRRVRSRGKHESSLKWRMGLKRRDKSLPI